MKLQTAGENALILYVSDTPSAQVSAQIQALAQALSDTLGDKLIDLIPSYASLLMIYNPLLCDHFYARTQVLSCLQQQRESASTESKTITLPVYYSAESGADLEQLAADRDLSVQEVIDLHTGRDYRVYAIGFAPGFAYLGEVDERIAAARHATPRQKVPAGAVAIADRQTAIYPAQSPGGWHLLGLCPTPMFNPDSTPHMPVATGDVVRFEAIDRQQFLTLGGMLP